ncbi:GNAT domain [Phaffia rhodozyma]|uniref:Acyl-CoA N acyltransferase GNAT family n=1 Tax=Phaffia rhodozyma TaxID=264483 RepID=A0A0F7SLD9_PHARH|nr:acyl-CoA N acyltransferase GNAT family [Phaffia rhodozyma]CDZ97782.1 GNAT domain [Phaffia rhodozyma]
MAPNLSSVLPLDQRPQLVISPVTQESDFYSLQHSKEQAFKDSVLGSRFKKNVPGESPPPYEFKITQRAISHQRSSQFLFPFQYEFQAALASNPSVPIGFAFWSSPVDRTSTDGEWLPEEIKLKESNEKALDSMKTDAEREADKWVNVEFAKMFKQTLYDRRKEYYKGKPHWYLHLLWVDPEFQGQGVSKALFEYGVSRARADGLQVYLESSEAGKPVYERLGFKHVGDIGFPPQAEGEQAIVLPMMVLDPR